MKDCSDAKMRKTGRSEADAVEIEPSITALWYNNLRPAACAAARTSCADALLRMGFENIEPCKNVGGAVLLGPQHGVMV